MTDSTSASDSTTGTVLQSTSTTSPISVNHNINHLPDALWHEILRYSTVQDLLRMEQVCRKFTLQIELNNALQQQQQQQQQHQLSLMDINELWKVHCRNRWKDKPRYKLTQDREAWLCQQYYQQNQHESTHTSIPIDSTIQISWKKAYIWMEQELARTTLTTDELESLEWYFNFTPPAGGRGKDTLLRCTFRHGLLFVTGFPPMPYRLLFARCNANGDEDDDSENDTDHFTTSTPHRQNHQQQQAVLVADFPLHFVSRLKDSGEWLMINPHVTFVSTDKEATLTYTDRNFQ